MPTVPLYVSSAGVLTIIAFGFAAGIIAVGRDYDRPYLRSWRTAWLALGVHALISASVLVAVLTHSLPTVRPALSVLALVSAWAHLFFLHEGMWALCLPQRRLPRWRNWVPGMALALAVALVFAPMDPMLRYEIRLTMLSVTWGITYILTGVLVVRKAPELSPLGRRALAGALLLYGFGRLLEPLTFQLPRSPVLEQFLMFGGLPLLVAMGAGMLITLLDAERRELVRAAEERSLALRAASESEAALAAALASSTDAVSIVDRELRLVAFNEPFRTIARAARGAEASLGMSLMSISPPERRAFWQAMFERAFAGEAQVLKHPIEDIGGRAPRLLSLRVTPVRRDGMINGVLVVGHDVTEEERLRTELERREARFRSLIENSSDIIIILSPVGTIDYVSPSVTRVLGHEPESLLGRNAFDFVHPDDADELRDTMQRIFDRDPSVPDVMPLRTLARNGEYARLEGVSRPFAEDDGTTRLIVSARDVRERLRLETELIAARRLETVGRLAGGVAHDFNNLLTAILGNVALMRGSVVAMPEVRSDLEEIAQSAQRGAELTRRLLAFARRQIIEPRVLDLGAQVRGLQRLLHRLLGEDVTLRLESAPALSVVRADPTALEQALVNLVVNARDAMPAGGTLTIRTCDAPIDGGELSMGVPDGAWVRIDVTDTGIGIDEDTLGKVFEPFFTTKGKMGGSGLGLATVYGIVSQAGGHVRVRSTPGVGTTFSLFFPRAVGVLMDPIDEEAVRDGAIPRAMPDETVLLIEDEESVRNVTARLLRGLGYRVLTAVDGADGIGVAEAHDGEIHAVVSDLVMPNIGGAEAVARIRERRPAVRVVFISGFSEDALGWRGAMPQGGRLLTKPFSRTDLARSVGGALD
ncbi:MAG: hybrid sensor histidine kinase/response regulator [Gemmatimonadaceae bacterium]